ncbi:MAG: hypothetical protein HZA79_13405 [Sphingobacteriales bacterium]|nr:hypothetical protein [Sphingobacteriales bacterium]
MKNKKSVYIIVAISLFVGLLHFIIGPGYRGIFRDFMRGYLIDILLPMNLFLLLQISLRKYMAVKWARISGAIVTFFVGTTVEILQFYKIEFLGRTFDPWDIVMYGIGIGLGALIDLAIIERFERQE